MVLPRLVGDSVPRGRLFAKVFTWTLLAAASAPSAALAQRGAGEQAVEQEVSAASSPLPLAEIFPDLGQRVTRVVVTGVTAYRVDDLFRFLVRDVPANRHRHAECLVLIERRFADQ